MYALQVPLRVCSAVTKMAEKENFLAVEAFHPCDVFALSFLADILEQHAQYCKTVTQPAKRAASINAAMQQQVEQSGLLQALPVLMARINPFLATGAKLQQGVPATAPDGFTINIAETLLDVQSRLSQMWAPGTHSNCQIGHTAVGALELAHAAFQVTGGLLKWEHTQTMKVADPGVDTEESNKTTASFLYKLLISAHTCVVEVAFQACAARNGSNAEHPAEAQQLKVSPHLLPCLAISCSALTLTQPAQRQAGACAAQPAAAGTPGNDSKRSKGAASTKKQRTCSVREVQPAAVQGAPAQLPLDDRLSAWTAARKQVKQLSECQHKVFKLLGVDEIVVLCLAHVEANNHAGVSSKMLALLQLLATCTASWEYRPQELQHNPDAQLQLHCTAQRLQLLLPPVLIPYARHAGADIAGANVSLQVCVTVLEGLNSLKLTPADCWMGGMLTQVLQLTDHWLQRAAAVAAAASDAESASVAAAAADPSLPASRLSVPAAESLRILCCLMRYTCCVKQAEMQPSASSTDIYTAAAKVAATDAAAAVDASTGGRKSSKQHKLLLEHSPPTGKRLAQLLARFEVIVRLLPSAAAVTNHWAHIETLGKTLRDVCCLLSETLVNPACFLSPNSPEQQQLCSFAHSLLKLHRSDLLQTEWPGQQAVVLHACMLSVCSIVAESDGVLEQRTDEGSGTESQNRADGPQATDTAGAIAGRSCSVLLTLFLFGQGCLALPQQLQRELDRMPRGAADAENNHWSKLEEQWRQRFSTCLHSVPALAKTLLGHAAFRACACAKHSSTTEKLASLGTITGQVLGKQLHKLADAEGEACLAAQLAATAAVNPTEVSIETATPSLDLILGQLRQELEATGAALSMLAVPAACNNPSCSNMAGPSEVALVSGRSCVCGGCRVAHYCSKACQKHHWKQHKPICAALVARAAVQESS
jgi:hypothetical protein